MDKFEELVWPAFMKYCSERRMIFNLDNVTKNVVKVVDDAVLLQKGIEKGQDVWVTLQKEFVRMIYQALLNNRKRITLTELYTLFPRVRGIAFVFKVFSALDNLFQYDFREKRIYLK